jgi:N-acetylneuraminate synthase
VRKVRIGERLVGKGERLFVVAEAGSNHDGKLEQAKELIKVAAEAGADAVKFQTFEAEKLYVKKAGNADYLKSPKSIFKIIKDLEMPYEWIAELGEYCRKASIIFLSTPYDEESADKLDEAGVPAYKISSYNVTHLPFLKYIARKGKPIILSTGASDLGEVREALETIYAQENEEVILLQCTASYPAPLEHINLKVMGTFEQAFQVPVGTSDHSRDPFIVPFAATALGANMIEKHFTIDNSLSGPDHQFAIEPDELKAMIKGIRGVEKALGSSMKEVTDIEKELYEFAKVRIHAIKDVKRGEVLTEKNIAILRSGKMNPGLAPKFWDSILGKKVTRDIKKYEGITWEDFLQAE